MRALNRRLSAAALAMAFMLVAILSLFGGQTALAAPAANAPTDPEDEPSLHKYVTPTDDPYVYQVKLSVSLDKEEIRPPSLITFVLDGTSSMAAADVSGLDRDVAVRSAVIAALNLLLGPDNAYQEDTYINIVMFGSTPTKAISLTEWATRGTTSGNGWSSAAWNPSISGGPGVFPVDGTSLPGIPRLGGSGAWQDNTARNGGTTFVPLLVNGSLNPVLGGLFGIQASEISNASYSPNATATAISNIYFYGNTVGYSGSTTSLAYYRRFPLSISGTYITAAMKMAYEDLSAEISSIQSKYSKSELDEMTKSVLVLADGDDSTRFATQSWAAAIKAPESVSVNTWSYPAANQGPAHGGPAFNGTQYNSGLKSGLDADIWSITLGGAGTTVADEQSNWQAFYLSNAYATPNTQIFMIMSSFAMAPDRNDSNYQTYWQDFAGNMSSWADWTTYYTLATHGYQASANTWYGGSAANMALAENVNYARATTLAQATSFFDKFAIASIPKADITGVQVMDAIGSMYEITNYGGKPQLETWSSDGSVTTASISNGLITWDIGSMFNATHTLTYFVRLDKDADPSLYYQTNEYAYISYTSSLGEACVKYFQVPYAKVGGEVENPEPEADSAPEATAEASGGMSALFAIPYGEGLNVYTPSVTPTNQLAEIQSENLQDAASEENIGDPPDTGNLPTTAVTLVLLALSAAGITYCVRQRKRRS